MPIHRRRGRDFVTVAGLSLAVALCAAPAEADTYCAALPPVGCNQNFADVQAALTAAAGHAGRDTVRIGPGQFTQATYNGGGGDPVDVVGAGAGVTEMVSNSSGATLLQIANVNTGSISTVSDLSAAVTRVNGIGISSANTAPGTFSQVSLQRVSVTGSPGVSGATGIFAWGSVRDSSVDMAPALAGATPNTGVNVIGFETSDGVTDSTVRSDDGVLLSSFSAAGSPRVLRSRVTALKRGVVLGSLNAKVANTLIHMVPNPDGTVTPGGLVAQNTLSAGAVTATISHTTIVSEGGQGIGLACHATPPDGAAQTTQTCNVRDSVIRGGVSWSRYAATTSGPVSHVANLSISFSNAESGGFSGGLGSTNVNTIASNPLLVDPPGLDFRLRGGSPAIDTGDPAGLAVGESVTDLNGSPRLVNGRRDMGAFEYQRTAPVVSAGATPGTVGVGAPVTLTATASDADGDPLTLTWTFDDGATASGDGVSHAWATAGAHTATVTATDPAGLSASAPATVNVVAPPPGGGIPTPPTPPTPPASPPPTLTAVAVSPKSFRAATSGASVGTKGTRVTFRLSGSAGAVRFSADRKEAGRSVKGSCVKPSAKNRKAKKCNRWVAQKGTFTRSGKLGAANSFFFTGRLNSRALSPGGYRLVASVGTGRLVSTRRAEFTIAAPAKRK